MTPRITNRKLESIAKTLESGRGSISLASSRLRELCVGNVRASDTFRIAQLKEEAEAINAASAAVRESIEIILLQRRSEARDA